MAALALAAALIVTFNRSRADVVYLDKKIDAPLARLEETLDVSVAGQVELEFAAATTGAERTRHLEASITAGEAATQSWTRYQAVALPLDGESELAARYERDYAIGKEVAADAIVPVRKSDRPEPLTPDQIEAAARNAADLRALRTLYQEEHAATLRGLDARMASTGQRIRIGGALCLLLVAVFGVVAIRLAGRTVRASRVQAGAAGLTAFDSQLVRGLELLEDDDQAMEVAARALALASPGSTIGIGTADHQGTAMRTAAGSLQCRIEGSDGCPAVRAGAPLRFEDSDALDACPHLVGVAPCSATCLPVSITGRSAGVAQLIGPVGSSPDPGGAVQVVVRRVGERITLMRAIARFELQASRDPLTGLINRRSLEAAVSDLQASRTGYAVAFADLDNFKLLNDTHGHQAGDQALCDFASTLASCLRGVDLACRWGGEEFVMVLPGCDEPEAAEAMERVRTQLVRDGLQGTRPAVTVSIGISVLLPGEAFSETVARADAALNAAKTTGRNRVVRWVGPRLKAEPVAHSVR